MMDKLHYISTRGEITKKSASQAILKGIADDGGLYVPSHIPKLDKKLEDIINLNYNELAYVILKLYLTDFTEEEIRYCIENAYDEKFDTKDIAPVVKSGDNFFLELFHGKTLAFKDMALSILPYFLTISAKKNKMDKKIVILTATSGDTGKAALEGFKDVENTSIIVFYPKDGVSQVQEKQMLTTGGKNTNVIAVYGNFDDTQTGVKKIFTDKELVKQLDEMDIVFSSANSINIGRLLPQIVYYFYAYTRLVKQGHINTGDLINFSVPTGNFGNILAGYMAKEMGLPINKLICASNDNKVLYDFFTTGLYNKNREFVLTTSPSMDILISSNLERLIYFLSDSAKTSMLYDGFSQEGKYTFLDKITDFIGEFSDMEETKEAINEAYRNSGYVMDTHTAVAYKAYKKASAKGLKEPCVIVSTASPYKFPESVLESIDNKYSGMELDGLFKALEEVSKVDVPKVLKNINNSKINFNKSCKREDMKSIIKEILQNH